MRKNLYFIESIMPHADGQRTPLELGYVIFGFILSLSLLLAVTTEKQVPLDVLQYYFLISLFLLLVTNISAYNYLCGDEYLIKHVINDNTDYVFRCVKTWIAACVLIVIVWPVLIPLSIVKYIRYCLFEPIINKKDNNQKPLYLIIIRKLLRKELVERKLSDKKNQN